MHTLRFYDSNNKHPWHPYTSTGLVIWATVNSCPSVLNGKLHRCNLLGLGMSGNTSILAWVRDHIQFIAIQICTSHRRFLNNVECIRWKKWHERMTLAEHAMQMCWISFSMSSVSIQNNIKSFYIIHRDNQYVCYGCI